MDALVSLNECLLARQSPSTPPGTGRTEYQLYLKHLDVKGQLFILHHATNRSCVYRYVLHIIIYFLLHTYYNVPSGGSG
jgi:hypothetical protein